MNDTDWLTPVGDEWFLSGSWPAVMAVDDHDFIPSQWMWIKGTQLFIQLTNAEAVYEYTGQRLNNGIGVYKFARPEI